MKRIISCLLCLSILFSMVPVGAFASEPREIIPETTAPAQTQQETQTAAGEQSLTEAPAETQTAATEVPTEEAPTEPAQTGEALQAPSEEPAPSEAETQPQTETAVLSSISAEADMDLPSDEALFAGYFYSALNLSQPEPIGIEAGDSLTGDVRLAYEALKPLMREIAAGLRTTAVVSIGHDIGKVSVNGEIHTYHPDVEVPFTGTDFGYNELTAVVRALLHDMPYELYWMDKVRGYGAEPIFTSSGKMFLTFYFYVSVDYSANGLVGTYELNKAVTTAATATAANAGKIVAEFAGLSDYEKLKAYKDRICQLTSYNSTAANRPSTPYGDPWQLIHVFDNDPTTKVVCEGYAKAFQYLCNLSSFRGNTGCLTVTGDMTHEGKTGKHMWNIVSIDRKSYLVDVTNCDTGFDLFLAGAKAQSNGTYTIDGINFRYDDIAPSQFGSELLTLQPAYYTPPVALPENVITGAELLDLVADREGTYTLEKSVVVTAPLELRTSASLLLPEGLHITVQQGGQLELFCDLAAEGSLSVQEGGALVVSGGASLSISHAGLTVLGDAVVLGQLINEATITIGEDTTGADPYAGGPCLTVAASGRLTSAGQIGILPSGTLDLSGSAELGGTVQNRGLIWMDGDVLLTGTLRNDHSIHIHQFPELDNIPGQLTIAPGASLKNHSYLSLMNGGRLIVDGELGNPDHPGETYNFLDLNGIVTVSGTFHSYNDVLLPYRWDDPDAPGQTASLTVTETGHADFGSGLYVYAGGTVTNNGTLSLVRSLVVEEGGVYTGKDPISNGYTALLSALEAGVASGEDVYFSGSAVVPEGSQTLPQLPEGRQLYLMDGGRITVPAGSHLTLRSPVHFLDADLTIASGGAVTNETQLYFAAFSGAGSDITIDGTFHNSGSLLLDGGADCQVSGTLVQKGLWILGSEEIRQENAPMARLLVGETGTLNLEAPYPGADTSLDVRTNGLLQVQGTLVQKNGSFLNICGGGLEFLDKGGYDETAGYGFIHNCAAATAAGQLYFSSLPPLPRDRLSLLADVSAMEGICLLLEEFSKGACASASLQICADMVLTDHLELPEGVSLVITDSENTDDPNTLTIPQDKTLTVRGAMELEANAALVNGGTFSLPGQCIASAGSRLDNSGTISVEAAGSLIVQTAASYTGSGAVGCVFVSPLEHGTAEGIGPESLVLVSGSIADQQDIQDALDHGAQKGFGSVILNIFQDLTLDASLVIPANTTVNLSGSSPETVTTFTVPAGLSLTNQGKFHVGQNAALVVEGLWEGSDPYGSGSITGGSTWISQDAFEQLLANAAEKGEPAVLPWNVRLVRPLDLRTDLHIAASGALLVPQDMILTIEDAELTVSGKVTVEKGGKLINRRMIHAMAESSVTIEGLYAASPDAQFRGHCSSGAYSAVSGIDPSLLTLFSQGCSTESALRELLALREDLGWGALHAELAGDVTLSAPLTIPARTTLAIPGGCTLVVPKALCVTNNGVVHILPAGTLILDGAWSGAEPHIEGTLAGVSQTMTDAEFRRLLSQEASGQFELQYSVVLEDHLTLPVDLAVGKHGQLTVPSGIRLTNPSVIDIYGSMTVEEGAILENSTLWVAADGSLQMHGDYIGETDSWNIQRQYLLDGSLGLIEGIPLANQTLCAEITTEQFLHRFLDTASQNGYGCAAAFLCDGFSLTRDLQIPKQVYLEFQGLQEDGVTVSPIEFYVKEGLTVTNYGRVILVGGASLTVDGIWEGEDPVPILGATVGGKFFHTTQAELEQMLKEQGQVTLKRSVTLEQDLVVEARQKLILEDMGELIVPDGFRLENNGLLQADYTGQITVEGTLCNRGTLCARGEGLIDISAGSYEDAPGASVLLSLTGYDGNRSHAAIWGVPIRQVTVSVQGNTESLIRDALAMGAGAVRIDLDANLVLGQGLYLPKNASMNIGSQDASALLTIPFGTTLTNDGEITIGRNGSLLLNGKLAGRLPALTDPSAEWVFGEDSNVLYTQETLEAELAQGGSPCLSIPLTLTRNLMIPEGVHLTLNSTLTIPSGRTLTINGRLDVSQNGHLAADSGGTVINSGILAAICGGSIDLREGSYMHKDGARVHTHYQATAESPVLGVPAEALCLYYDGCSGEMIRALLTLAEQTQPRELNLTVTGGEITLEKNLTIPDYVLLRIRDGGVLTVPNSVTLTNQGRIEIDRSGSLIVRSRGALTGFQPLLVSQDNAQYENEAVSPEAQLLSDIAAAEESGNAVLLSRSVILTKDLDIPEDVTVILSGSTTLEIPSGITLTNCGTITAILGGTVHSTGGILINDGEIQIRSAGLLHMDSPELYRPTETGEAVFFHYGSQQGDVSYARSQGILPEHMRIVVDGCSEAVIRELLAYAGGLAQPPRYLEINITEGTLILSSDLYLPDYASVTIGAAGKAPGALIVPKHLKLVSHGAIRTAWGGSLLIQSGAALHNHSGSIHVEADSCITLEPGAELVGSHPVCTGSGASYHNPNVYGHEYLHSRLVETAETGGTFILSVPIRLEQPLEIPHNVQLLITGQDSFLTIPKDITLTNYGSIVCHSNGGLLSEGGTLENHNTLRVMNSGIVDMTRGRYVPEENAMVFSHHRAYAEEVSHAAVLGIAPAHMTFQVEGDQEQIFRELTDRVLALGNSATSPAALEGTVTGNLKIRSDLHWPGLGRLLVPETASLTVCSGATLYVDGIIDVFGQLIIEEGAQVVAHNPVIGHSPYSVINYSDSRCAWYIPGAALERFSVAASAAYTSVGVPVDLVVTEQQPVSAQIFGLHYEILDGKGSFFADREPCGSQGIVSTASVLSVMPEAEGSLTVRITPVTGFDEAGHAILCEISDTVTIDVPALTIRTAYGNHGPAILCNPGPDQTPGLYAGSTLDLMGFVYNASHDKDLGSSQIRYALGEGDEHFVSMTAAEGNCTLEVREDLTASRVITVNMVTADDSAPAAAMRFTLMPKAKTVDIRWKDDSVVSGKRVLYDLNREGWRTGLQPVTNPACCALTNDTALRFEGGQVLHWASSNEKIATVDGQGNVFFQGTQGDVTITMTTRYNEVRKTSMTFQVVNLPRGIAVGEDLPVQLLGGASQDYHAVSLDDGSRLGSGLIRWSLCDQFGNPIESHPYAAVSSDGRLTTRAVADETKVFLMARSAGNMLSLEQPLEVTLQPEIRSVQILDINGDPINGKYLLYDLDRMGRRYALSCSVLPVSDSVRSLSWASDNPAVAQVDASGVITATGRQGDVTFTLTVTDLSGGTICQSFQMRFGTFATDLDVTVKQPDGSVTGLHKRLYLCSGESLRFSAACLSHSGSYLDNVDVRWSLEDSSAAVLSSRGVLTAKTVTAPTTVLVSASSTDQFCRLEIPVTILPSPVMTGFGSMDALVIRNGFHFLSSSGYVMAPYTEETIYAVDARSGETPTGLTWRSSDESVASVSSAGLLRTCAEGSCTITAIDSFGREASFPLRIGRRAQSLRISSENGFTLASGSSLAFTGTVSYSDGSTDQAVLWSLRDTAGAPVSDAVASVSEDGVLTAAEGLTRAVRVQLWAAPADGSFSLADSVSVTLRPAATGIEILLDPDQGSGADISNSTIFWDLRSSSLHLGSRVYPYFGASAPMNAGNAMQTVHWSSSNTAIADVDEHGTVTMHSSGTVTITASASGQVQASCQLRIIRQMDNLSLPKTASVTAGQALDLKALEGYQTDPLATDPQLRWTMVFSDGQPVPAGIATLDDGVLATGETTHSRVILVRAAATDGSNLAAECAVTVQGLKPASILVHPADVRAAPGKSAAVSVEAEGEGLTYAWYARNQKDGTFLLVSGARSPSYSVTMSAALDGRQVYCIVTDKFGNTAQTRIAAMRMCLPEITILSQPQDTAVKPGVRARVSLAAEGENLRYTWYIRNRDETKFTRVSARGNAYTATMKASVHGRQVYCVITDKYNTTVQTNIVTLTMDVPPLTIVQQPRSVTAAPEENAAVSVEAEGDGLTYKWYRRKRTGKTFSRVRSFKGATYSAVMEPDTYGQQVYCVITDQYGISVQTETVTLDMVITDLAIVTQPQDTTVHPEASAAVSVAATGDGLTYKWYRKNPGKKKFSLARSCKGPDYSVVIDLDTYGQQVYCVVTDWYGNSLTTDTVTLDMVITDLAIVTQPQDMIVHPEASAAVSVAAAGDGLTYKWYCKNPGKKKFSLVRSCKGPEYSVVIDLDTYGQQVYCVVTDWYGNSLTTDTVTLDMVVTDLAILEEPETVTANHGESAAVSVKAQGDGLRYKWYCKKRTGKKFSVVKAFKGPDYAVTMDPSTYGQQVYCVITDWYGNSVQTETVTLNVHFPDVTILRQPENACAASGKSVTVSLEAEGVGLRYQWFYKDPASSKFLKVSGTKRTSYKASMTSRRNGRQVYCVITDLYGTVVQTQTVTLTME